MLFVGLWAVYLWSDLKFRIWRHPEEAASGAFSATAEAIVDSTMNHALSTAKDAMKRIGSSDPRIDYDAHQVTGWVGVNVNWAKQAEYQLVVSFRNNPDGRLVLTCRGRPRIRFFFFVWGDMRYRSDEHVQRLTAEICRSLEAPRSA
jgi:hypothetical protein